jgi:alkaline phosphatase D
MTERILSKLSSKLSSGHLSRRQFLLTSASVITGSSILYAKNLPIKAQAPNIITSEKMRPQIPYGVASGDINGNSSIIWSKTDRSAKMIVEYSTNENFRNSQRIIGAAALEVSDYTAKLYLSDLPYAQQIFYRVTFEDLANPGTYSQPVTGTFRTPYPTKFQTKSQTKSQKDIFFAWSGDTAGQGWGINPEFGGMKIYESIRRLNPDFFIHSGDYIYADVPIQAEVKLDDGSIWKNITTPEKSKVAETLAEFRGNYIYNLLDKNILRFNREIPQLVQWDDHETVNNWYPGKMLLDDNRYQVKSVSLLAARGKQAFLEYTPTRINANDPERIYRSFQYGQLLEIFMLDQRSYRGPNSSNNQKVASNETTFLGNPQLRWLKQKLRNSSATWKVIASDMPLGLIVRDGKDKFENQSNGDGQPLGRELELVELLKFIKEKNISNIVWLTADVHYAAAHYYNPNKAQFTEFKPFWEFVAGPLNSGTFGPAQLDNTFGPEVKFQSLPPQMKQNRPPSEGLQFFGSVKIDSQTQVMKVVLHNIEGKNIYAIDLQPESRM